LKTISLDELIGNLQTYELRRNSQQQEETKKDCGITLNVMEEDSSDLDDEDMDMLVRKFKKFFKKSKESIRKKHPSKFKNTDPEQFLGCFKCGKFDHIVKNCPQLKEEQDAEPPKKQGRKRAGNSSSRRFTRAMLAAWGDSTEEEEGSEEEEEAVALMARSETDSDEESIESLNRLKNKVCGLNKAKLKEFLFTLMDECDALHSENRELKDACAELKRDTRELEHENNILEDEKSELDMQSLVLHEDLERAKETFRLKEETFVTNLTKLEKESLELKQKVESLLVENNKLHEMIKQVEIDQATNRHWNDSS